MVWVTLNVAYILLNFYLLKITGYNIDTKDAIIFSGTPDSYFGYTVALLKNREGSLALVSAPRANWTTLGDPIHEPGALLKCKISFASRTPSCVEVTLDTTGNHVPGGGREFSHVDNKDNMFLGVSLDVQQNVKDSQIVTCGHLWKNQFYDEQYLANGVCYVVDNDLHVVKKLLPLSKRAKQSIKSAGVYYYAFGQAGTSAAFSEDGKYLLLGAPGFFDWTGTVISYNAPNIVIQYKDPAIPDPPGGEQIKAESYIGYSVTSGKFFENSDIFIAAGAPRANDGFGQVYIIKALRSKYDTISIHLKKEGTQLGEYFGAACLGENINNDKWTDLLVASPFYSTESGGDEGKVYVYLSTGVSLVLSAELYGTRKSNSRFGTCISSLGDINQDGYKDIAIGAPYEDSTGAVYIYHGSSTGLNKQYAQRISANTISLPLSGFGISISRGLDIDSNYYPDLLIGSYSSSKAVLLRTHPIIQMQAKMEFYPQQINVNVTSCEFEGKNVTCINVTTCLQFTGKHTSMTYDFETKLFMDFSRQAVAFPRGYLILNGKSTSVIQRQFSLDVGINKCYTDEGYIHVNAKDVITPIDFHFAYNLVKNNTMDKFCKLCPVIDTSSSTNLTKSIFFHTGCGTDNKCIADLVVEAKMVGNPKNLPIIVGTNSTLTIKMEVFNEGEPAYLPELLIHLPNKMPNANQDSCNLLTDQKKQELNATLQCDLGNPLLKGQKVPISIKVDISKIPYGTSHMTIFLFATTASIEANPQNNILEFPIYFTYSSDISIMGTAENEQIQYNNTEKKSVSIHHTYFVMNYGPSPVQAIDIELFIPNSFQDGSNIIEFLSYLKIVADSGDPLTIPATCNDSSIQFKPLQHNVNKSKDEVFNVNNLADQEANKQPLKSDNLQIRSENTPHLRAKKSINDRSSDESQDYSINCKTAKCIVLHCSTFIEDRKYARIEILVHLNTSTISSYLNPWYRIEYVTSGRVFIKGKKHDIQVQGHYPDETTVKTVLVHPGPPPSPKIEKWIIFVSIGVGILLLLIILFILIKIGFFKRQQKDKMREMMLNTEEEKEWEPYAESEKNNAEPDGTSTANATH